MSVFFLALLFPVLIVLIPVTLQFLRWLEFLKQGVPRWLVLLHLGLLLPLLTFVSLVLIDGTYTKPFSKPLLLLGGLLVTGYAGWFLVLRPARRERILAIKLHLLVPLAALAILVPGVARQILSAVDDLRRRYTPSLVQIQGMEFDPLTQKLEIPSEFQAPEVSRLYLIQLGPKGWPAQPPGVEVFGESGGLIIIRFDSPQTLDGARRSLGAIYPRVVLPYHLRFKLSPRLWSGIERGEVLHCVSIQDARKEASWLSNQEELTREGVRVVSLVPMSAHMQVAPSSGSWVAEVSRAQWATLLRKDWILSADLYTSGHCPGAAECANAPKDFQARVSTLAGGSVPCQVDEDCDVWKDPRGFCEGATLPVAKNQFETPIFSELRRLLSRCEAEIAPPRSCPMVEIPPQYPICERGECALTRLGPKVCVAKSFTWGRQCETPASPAPPIKEMSQGPRAELLQAKIEILEEHMGSCAVCEACGCPALAGEFQFVIPRAAVAKAQEHGFELCLCAQ